MTEAISTFTIRGLKEALRWLSPKQTALLRGRHGIGKSAVAYQMAPIWGLNKVIERRISQLSEGDMIGLPDRGAVRQHGNQDHPVTKFLPTDWFLEAEFEPCLIFLDEINRGTPETMQACFQFIEKGELNGRKIHPESRIIAAINFSKEYNVTQMDPAFWDRFWIADLEPDKADWLNWAQLPIEKGGGGISVDVIDFIRQCNEDHFEIRPDKIAQLAAHEVTPSRRSWERLDRHINRDVSGQTLAEMPSAAVFYDVCRGFVGPDASRALSKFMLDRNQSVSPEDVIDNFDKIKDRIKRLKPEAQVVLIDKIKHFIATRGAKLTDKQADNLGRFMKSLTPEVGVTLWNALAQCGIDDATMFHRYIAKHFVSMLAETKIGTQLPSIKSKSK